MSGDDSNEKILVGRIYPAIRSCVGNRYKLIIGLFAFYAFLYQVCDDVVCLRQKRELAENLRWVFAFLVVHNAFNYWMNKREQDRREKNSTQPNRTTQEFSFRELLQKLWKWIKESKRIEKWNCIKWWLVEFIFSAVAIYVVYRAPEWFLP